MLSIRLAVVLATSSPQVRHFFSLVELQVCKTKFPTDPPRDQPADLPHQVIQVPYLGERESSSSSLAGTSEGPHMAATPVLPPELMSLLSAAASKDGDAIALAISSSFFLLHPILPFFHSPLQLDLADLMDGTIMELQVHHF